jgi:hypothetical protein
MNETKFKVVETGSLPMDECASELLSSPEMQPYLRYIQAAISGADTGPSVSEITRLPLEKRYVWRVASALRWGLADVDGWNVAVDIRTLQPEDFKKLVEFLSSRPIQLCIFLKALVGSEQMEEIMTHAITVAKEEA